MVHAALRAARDLVPLIAKHADETERERRLARRWSMLSSTPAFFASSCPLTWVVLG